MLKLIVTQKKKYKKDDLFYAERYEAIEERTIDEILNVTNEKKLNSLIGKLYFARVKKCCYKYSYYKKNENKMSFNDIKELFFYFSEAIESLKTLTPKVLQQLFPISKIYDGEKFDCLDYYTTKKSLSEFNENEPFYITDYKFKMTEEELKKREEKVSFLIMEYQNKDIRKFNIGYMVLSNKLNRMINGTDAMDKLFEEFPKLKENSIKSYTDKNGKKYFIDSKGKAHRARPNIPKNWKIITTKK